ncbi:MAG: hypothetical protein PF961_04105 [Planctomycetota bacterium]|nr:hypothetical protein [Planctomycetota bacterium]
MVDPRQLRQQKLRRRGIALVLVVLLAPVTYVGYQRTVELGRQVDLHKSSNKGFGDVGNRLGTRFGGRRSESSGLLRMQIQRDYGMWMTLTFMSGVTAGISLLYLLAPGYVALSQWSASLWRQVRSGSDT